MRGIGLLWGWCLGVKCSLVNVFNFFENVLDKPTSIYANIYVSTETNQKGLR